MTTMLERVRARAAQRRRDRRIRRTGLAGVAAVALVAVAVALASGPTASSLRTTPADDNFVHDGTSEVSPPPGDVGAGRGHDNPAPTGPDGRPSGASGTGAAAPGLVGPPTTKPTVPGTSTTRPPAAPPTGEIAYERGERIWLVNADGSKAGALTDGSQKMGDPDWAPDGRSLVATSWYTDATGIAVSRLVSLGLDGTVRPLTGEGRYAGPKWSPDGTRIAFALVVSKAWLPPEFELWVMDADGTDQRRLTGSTGARLSWSPDGSRLAYECAGLCTIKGDGTEARQIPETVNHFAPAWSPDGGRLAVATSGPAGESIVTMALDGSDRRKLTDVFATQLDWSPDGRTLVFAGNETTCNCMRLSRIAADGSNRRLVTTGGSDEERPSWRPR